MGCRGGDHFTGDLPVRLAKGLSLIGKAGPVSRADYAHHLGVRLRTASPDLAAHLDTGLVVRDGRSGRDAGYLESSDRMDAEGRGRDRGMGQVESRSAWNAVYGSPSASNPHEH